MSNRRDLKILSLIPAISGVLLLAAGIAGFSYLVWFPVEFKMTTTPKTITTSLASSADRDRNNENLQAQAGCPTGTCSQLGGLNRTAQVAQQTKAVLAHADVQNPTAGQNPTLPPPKIFTAKAMSYYPHNDRVEGGFKDRRSRPLYTLGQYLRGRAPSVLVAMDPSAFEYVQKLSIPELDATFGKKIEF